ncbi:hypothetical protein D3C79_1066750 [compost metagenome]
MDGEGFLQLLSMIVERSSMDMMLRPLLYLFRFHRFGLENHRDVPLDRSGRLQHLQKSFFSAHSPPPACLSATLLPDRLIL